MTANRSASASLKSQNELFNQEQKRQRDAIGRVEKIEVRYLGLPEDVTLVMNNHISTPYNCAQHLSEGHCKRAALALIDGSVAWDMHRPLQESCTLQLLTFNVTEPHVVNKCAYTTNTMNHLISNFQLYVLGLSGAHAVLCWALLYNVLLRKKRICNYIAFRDQTVSHCPDYRSSVINLSFTFS